MSAEKGTGAITGITNFLFLAFILPGVIYLCFILVLFPFESIQDLFPGLEMGLDVAVGAVIFLGLTITSIIFAIEVLIRLLWDLRRSQKPKFGSYAEVIFNADRQKELGWYFWQLWGQSIMHWNIGAGIFMIYAIYKYVNNEVWPWPLWFSSWKDFTLVVIAANLVCGFRFSQWYSTLIAKLMHGGIDY